MRVFTGKELLDSFGGLSKSMGDLDRLAREEGHCTPMLTVTIRTGEDGYVVAECQELPGCMSQGRNEREALRNIADAIQSCLAVRLK